MLQLNAMLSSLSAATQPPCGRISRPPICSKRKCCLRPATRSTRVYFPITAVVSLVVTLATGETTETAMVGKDGAVGIASALDGKIAMCRAIVQLGGDAMVCDPAAFRGAALQSRKPDFQDHAA